jgi:hypothetical protein
VKISNAVKYSTYALSVGTTTVSTIIIVTRILLVSRRGPSGSRKLRLAAEIIAESAILYTISALVYIGMISSPYARFYTDAFFSYMGVRFPLHPGHSSPSF